MEAIIFDMDGVLIDSEPLYMKYLYDFFQEHGQTIAYHKLIKVAGSSNKETWRMLGEWWNPPMNAEEMEGFYTKYVTHEEVDFTWFLNPYVTYILPKLKEEGYKLAIASSSSLVEIENMCQQNNLLAFFDILVSGDVFEESKPNPEIYMYTMRKLQVAPSDCIIIEDSDYGITAGKKAGAYVIAKHDKRLGFHQKDADIVVSDLLEAYLHIQERK